MENWRSICSSSPAILPCSNTPILLMLQMGRIFVGLAFWVEYRVVRENTAMIRETNAKIAEKK